MNKKFVKQFLFDALLFLILISATFWIIFKDKDLNRVIAVTQAADFNFILLGMGCMLMYFAMEARNIQKLLRSFGEKISFLRAYKLTMIGFFFAGITPGASGGQPVEIYYMTKDGISAGNGALALLVQVCGVQISVMILGVIGMFFNYYLLAGPVRWLLVIGTLINGLALVAMLVCIFSNQLTKKLVRGAAKLLKKMGFKSVEKKQRSIERSLNQYAKGSDYIKAHKSEFWAAMFRVFIQFCFYFAVPFCVYKAFGLSGSNFFQLFMMQAVLFMSTSALPLPGAIGVSESVFLSLFGAAFGETMLSSAMLLNRGITFYGFVVLSMLVVFMNSVFLRRRKELP